MKHLHIPTILVTLGLVGLVAILSGQSTVGTPRVVVHNPLGVPGWVPSGVWMASHDFDTGTGAPIYQDYTVPAGHFALVRSMTADSNYQHTVQVDIGNGFVDLSGLGYSGNELDPGIVVDEGATIRANARNQQLMTVHGYVIPK